MDSVFCRLVMVLSCHHVRLYIMTKGRNVLVRVVTNVHFFRNLVLDFFAVLIENMIISVLFINSLGQGIQEFTKPKDFNSTFVTFFMILRAFSKINGIFVAEPLRKNHRSRACTADSEREDGCLHPAPGVGSQRLLVLFKEIIGLVI